MKLFSLILLICFSLLTDEMIAQMPSLPSGAQTEWSIKEPEEIVSWILFDPATVENRLPSALRFISVEELASRGIEWANDYLEDHSSQSHWGISFLEIVRMNRFSIDAEEPAWPNKGAVALWFARVAPADPAIDLGPGQPFLALEFWIPDSTYVNSIRKKGHYATFGNVTLRRDDEGKWHGSIDVDGLTIVAECMPIGPAKSGEYSSGMQTIFPPRVSGIKSTVQIAFAGHRIQECKNGGSWNLSGPHPLTTGVLLNPSEFQFGYELIGGAYLW